MSLKCLIKPKNRCWNMGLINDNVNVDDYSTRITRISRMHASWTRVWPPGLINDDDNVDDDSLRDDTFYCQLKQMDD